MIDWVVSIWGTFSDWLAEDFNSEYSITREVAYPFFAALFATICGVVAGAWLSQRSSKLSSQYRDVNYLVLAASLCGMICSRALEKKKRIVKPSLEEFEAQRAEFKRQIASSRDVVRSTPSLYDMAPPEISTDHMQEAFFSTTSMDSRKIAYIEALRRACAGLEHYVIERQVLIAEYRASDMSAESEAYWYFGEINPSNGKDSRYRDNLNNIAKALDSIIGLSFHLYQGLTIDAVTRRQRLARPMRSSSGIVAADFREYYAEGLFPDLSGYSSWEDYGKPTIPVKFWWSNSRRRREIAKTIRVRSLSGE